MSWSDSRRDDRLEIAAVESIIASARDFVVPTDDFRPQTLDAAREQAHDVSAQRQLGAFFVCAVLLLFTCVPVVDYLGDIQSRLRGPTSGQLQKIGEDQATRGTEGVTWGLVEAFTQWRRSQAEFLGNPIRD